MFPPALQSWPEADILRIPLDKTPTWVQLMKWGGGVPVALSPGCRVIRICGGEAWASGSWKAPQVAQRAARAGDLPIQDLSLTVCPGHPASCTRASSERTAVCLYPSVKEGTPTAPLSLFPTMCLRNDSNEMKNGFDFPLWLAMPI